MIDSPNDPILAIVEKLLEATRSGKAKWIPTDQSNVFSYSGSKSSVLIRGWDDNDGDFNARVTLLNGDGLEVGAIASTWDGTEESPSLGYGAGENNLLLAGLYEEAKRSALKVDEVIQSLFNDLG